MRLALKVVLHIGKPTVLEEFPVNNLDEQVTEVLEGSPLDLSNLTVDSIQTPRHRSVRIRRYIRKSVFSGLSFDEGMTPKLTKTTRV